MRLHCPNCQQHIHETKTFDTDRNDIRHRMLCPGCQIGLRVILLGRNNQLLSTKSIVVTILASLLLQIISLFWSITWLAIASHCLLIGLPMLLLLIDTLIKRTSSIELKLDRIPNKIQ